MPALPRVLAEPVRRLAFVLVHIEAAQQDPPRAEVRGQVHGLVPRIAAGPKMRWPVIESGGPAVLELQHVRAFERGAGQWPDRDFQAREP